MNVLLRMLLDLLLRFVRSLDLPLLGALLALMGVGLATLYSASNESMRVVLTQGVYFSVGLGALWVASRAPAHLLKQFTPVIYALSILPLVIVLFIGSGKYGNHWIDLGFFNLQPSELAKLTLPMMLAWYMDRQRLPPKLSSLPMALLIIALPVGLILLQRDLGTAVLVLAAGVFVLFLSGLSWWWFGIAGVFGATGFAMAMFAPIRWFSFLRPYQQDRILTFRNPENDPMGAGWNILQSKIAIGGGGLTGKGWTEGTQSHLDFLPESHTDFIIAVMGEEFGLVGICALLLIYLLLIGRGLVITAQAQTLFGKLLAGSLTMTFFVYVFVNIGMVSGLLPVVGVPLPFISYGGTSLVTLLSAFGVLMSIHTHRKWIAPV